MCGVYAIFDHNLRISKNDKINSLNSFKHRGPDNTNFIEINNLFLGHHRLSIRDLSNNSNQPKFSNNKNIVITYNGEIYNCNELLEDLDLRNVILINRNSDTEVLANYIEIFGINQTLKKIKGMFAFIYFDIKKNKIIAARDPFGEKPLYIYGNNKNFILTSDIDSIKKLDLNLNISLKSSDLFFRLSFIPSPFSIYENIFKLSPGEFIEINCGISDNYNDCLIEKYFNPIEDINSFDSKVSKKEIHEKLFSSVESQLISDVNIGTFLSGGIDSSLITAIAAKINPKLSTFTIGFNDNFYDESIYAKQISSQLGLKNYCLKLNPQDLLEIINDISNIYSEPFGDSSQIPTFYLSKFSKERIKVALTGDGGDELFGGYTRYINYKKFKYFISSPSHIKKFIKLFIPLLPLHQTIKDKIKKKILDIDDISSYYYSMIDQAGLNKFPTHLKNNLIPELFKKVDNKKFDDITYLQILDILHYLPDDILVKTDRASMFNGLETRAPFLNKEIYKSSMSLESNQKISFLRGGKIILKDILSDYISPNFFNRPKKGFGIPIASWLRADLKDWAQDKIFDTKLSHIVDTNFFQNLFKDHLNKKQDYSNILWNYLIFYEWHEKRF